MSRNAVQTKMTLLNRIMKGGVLEKVIKVLKKSEKQTVHQIYKSAKIKQPAASSALSDLMKLNVVYFEKEAQKHIYTLNEHRLKEVQKAYSYLEKKNINEIIDRLN